MLCFLGIESPYKNISQRDNINSATAYIDASQVSWSCLVSHVVSCCHRSSLVYLVSPVVSCHSFSLAARKLFSRITSTLPLLSLMLLRYSFLLLSLVVTGLVCLVYAVVSCHSFSLATRKLFSGITLTLPLLSLMLLRYSFLLSQVLFVLSMLLSLVTLRFLLQVY